MLSNKGLPINMSFYDDFCRPNTESGTIGNPVLGKDYYLAGPNLIQASESRIVDKRWVTEPYQTTYLCQTLDKPVTNIGSKVKWLPGNGWDSEGVYVLLLCEYSNENIAWNCIHIRLTRYGLAIDLREHNNTIYSESVYYSRGLAINTDYTFDFDYIPSKGIIYCNVEGETSQIIANKLLINRGGTSAAYEHFYNTVPTTKISVCSIWAS